jgi:3-oxoadipate enol-lactonase
MMGDTTLTDPARADVLADVTAMLRSRTAEYALPLHHISHRLPVLDELASITVPVVVVAGTEDHTYPPHKSQQIADGIAGATLEVMERTGHVHAKENPDAVVDVLERHLADLQARTARA